MFLFHNVNISRLSRYIKSRVAVYSLGVDKYTRTIILVRSLEHKGKKNVSI